MSRGRLLLCVLMYTTIIDIYSVKVKKNVVLCKDTQKKIFAILLFSTTKTAPAKGKRRSCSKMLFYFITTFTILPGTTINFTMFLPSRREA